MPRGGSSIWWPTPVRATDHFSAEDLADSQRLHGPARRGAVASVILRIVGLGGAAWLLGRLGDPDGPGPLAARGTTVRSLVAAGAVVAVLASAALASPAGARSAGRSSPSAVLAPLGVGVAVLALAARWVLGPLADDTTGWLLAGAGAALVVTIGAVAMSVQVERAPAVEAPAAWRALVDRAAVGGEVRLGLLATSTSTSTSTSMPDPGLAVNACAVGVGGRRAILVDPRLVPSDGPSPTDAGAEAEGDGAAPFVVAHELAHLARRHPEVQLVLNAVIVLGALVAVPTLAGTGWPWAAFGLEPDEPLSLPVTVLVVGVAGGLLQLPVRWVLRALERSADATAADLVGIPDRDRLRDLHLLGGGDLAPPWWAQALAAHPSPAQRMEFLTRLRRAGQSGTPALHRWVGSSTDR